MEYEGAGPLADLAIFWLTLVVCLVVVGGSVEVLPGPFILRALIGLLAATVIFFGVLLGYNWLYLDGRSKADRVGELDDRLDNQLQVDSIRRQVEKEGYDPAAVAEDHGVDVADVYRALADYHDGNDSSGTRRQSR